MHPCVCVYEILHGFFAVVCVWACVRDLCQSGAGGQASKQASKQALPASGKLTEGCVQGHSPGPQDVWMDELMKSNGVTLSI